MDDNLEQAKKKTDECQADLTYELDAYTLSLFRPSASRLSDQFLATNRKAFHHKKMRQIVNEFFNKEEDYEPTMSLSQKAAFPSQTLALTLAEYRNSRYYRELLQKKTEECKAALIEVLETYIQSCFPSSATGRSAQFFANLQSFYRKQMLLLIDNYFNSEDNDLPNFPSSTTVHSVNQLDVTSNQESAQVDTTPASPSISPVTPSDQQQLVNSGEAQVKEKPIDVDSSAQPRIVDALNTIENIVIVSITEQEQSDYEADSDCGCDDCMADKGRAQAVMISLDCDNSEPPPNDANEELPTAGNGSEITNNQAKDDVINSLLNQEKNQVEKSVAQVQTDAQQQQALVPTAVNANNEQVDNSVNNFENLMDLVMDFCDDVAVNEQVDAEPIIDEAFVDETFPIGDFVSRPSTSIGRQSTRSKKMVNYAMPEDDSDDEYSTVNRNRKRTILRAGEFSTHKRVAVEPVVATENEEEEDDENEEEEEGVEGESVRLSIIVHHLNCPEAGCTEECPDKAQLNGHLLSKHQINEFRCKVKDCGLSFATPNELSDHRKLAHRNVEDLPCAKCETISKGFKKLHDHFRQYHEEGEFGCSADKCDFTGKTRVEVYIHQYKHQPRKYVCTFANCTAAFKRQSSLTIHEWAHSGLKPYICTWSECDYSARQRANVYTHVRTVHFGLPASKKEQDEQNIIDSRDAGEFIEKNPTK